MSLISSKSDEMIERAHSLGRRFHKGVEILAHLHASSLHKRYLMKTDARMHIWKESSRRLMSSAYLSEIGSSATNAQHGSSMCLRSNGENRSQSGISAVGSKHISLYLPPKNSYSLCSLHQRSKTGITMRIYAPSPGRFVELPSCWIWVSCRAQRSKRFWASSYFV